MPDDRIASRARAAAVHCEARKIGYRQSKEGMVVSFVIHPDEMPDSLAVAGLGARYMLALVEIADDETPIVHEVRAPDRLPETRQPVQPTAPGREHRSEAARERFKLLGEPEQMVTRCALTCKDPRFWSFADVENEEQARAFVCSRLDIGSRSELAANAEAQRRWKRMMTDFDIFTGAQAAP